jgi:hypothetical protein
MASRYFRCRTRKKAERPETDFGRAANKVAKRFASEARRLEADPLFMPPTRLLFTLLASLALGGAGCRDPKITSYTIPKEAAPAATVAADPTMTTLSHSGPLAPAGPMAQAPTMANTPVPTADGASLAWTTPAGWKSVPLAAGSLRKATFAVPGPGGSDADLSITAFPGELGGEQANIERWHGQVQLPTATPAEMAAAVTRTDQNGLHQVIVEFANPKTDADHQHLIAALISFNGSTWVFKLIGADSVVSAARPAFLGFLQSIKAP